MEITVTIEIPDEIPQKAVVQAMREAFTRNPGYRDQAPCVGWNSVVKQVNQAVNTMDFTAEIQKQAPAIVSEAVREALIAEAKKHVKKRLSQMTADGSLFQSEG